MVGSLSLHWRVRYVRSTGFVREGVGRNCPRLVKRRMQLGKGSCNPPACERLSIAQCHCNCWSGFSGAISGNDSGAKWMIIPCWIFFFRHVGESTCLFRTCWHGPTSSAIGLVKAMPRCTTMALCAEGSYITILHKAQQQGWERM